MAKKVKYFSDYERYIVWNYSPITGQKYLYKGVVPRLHVINHYDDEIGLAYIGYFVTEGGREEYWGAGYRPTGNFIYCPICGAKLQECIFGHIIICPNCDDGCEEADI